MEKTWEECDSLVTLRDYDGAQRWINEVLWVVLCPENLRYFFDRHDEFAGLQKHNTTTHCQ